MWVVALIILVAWYYYAENKKNNQIDIYDISKIDTAKLTRDMDKPLHIREQNLLAGKYDKKN